MVELKDKIDIRSIIECSIANMLCTNLEYNMFSAKKYILNVYMSSDTIRTLWKSISPKFEDSVSIHGCTWNLQYFTNVTVTIYPVPTMPLNTYDIGELTIVQ